jgi:hypothetical protein
VNADTGIVYDLSPELVKDIPVGGEIPAERFEGFLVTGQPLSRRVSLQRRVDSAKGDALVRVRTEAAQRARLGDRELRRRKQRRPAMTTTGPLRPRPIGYTWRPKSESAPGPLERRERTED